MSDEYRLEARLEAIESNIRDIQDENKNYYDSISAKIHLFYFMFMVFFVLMIWLHFN